MTDPELLVRKITISANHIPNENEVPKEVQEQPDLFADHEALAGCDDAVAETVRLTEARLELNEQEQRRKSGGEVVEASGKVVKISVSDGIIVMAHGPSIPLSGVIAVSSQKFDNIV